MHPTYKMTSILICLTGPIKTKLLLLLIHHFIFGQAAHLKLPGSIKQAKSTTTYAPFPFAIKIKLPLETVTDKLKSLILPNEKK